MQCSQKVDSRYLLFATRTLRGFIYGVFSVVTIIYLIKNNLTPLEAGITVTASILVSSFLTFYVTSRYGSGYAKQFLLIFSILLLVGITGLFLSPSPIFKAIFAIVGSLGVNPSDNTLFSAYEQPIIAGIVEDQKAKNRLFARYTFGGYIAASFGALALNLGLNTTFKISMLFAAVVIISYVFIPSIKGKKRVNASPVSRKSKVIARDVSALFSVDALAGGFVLQSLMAYWFSYRYGFSISELGYVFTVVDIITAVSVLVTPYIASRIGLVRTMVFTHIPSNVFLILIPLVPTLPLSLLFLFLRQSISQMDVPTRQSYLNSVVEGEDRSYVVGMSNAMRSTAQGATPYISSYMISVAAGALSFVAGGVIKIAYDIAFYERFKALKEHYGQEKK
ncbi:MAG: Major facilitator superfamily MFS_1 [Thermoplasmatales archaeon I-plasma]|nr:MAG: Major facilitator superfamily MFS_1 [Thermoplasmatales archaeon I-plasma]